MRPFPAPSVAPPFAGLRRQAHAQLDLHPSVVASRGRCHGEHPQRGDRPARRAGRRELNRRSRRLPLCADSDSDASCLQGRPADSAGPASDRVLRSTLSLPGHSGGGPPLAAGHWQVSASGKPNAGLLQTNTNVRTGSMPC